MKAREAGKSGRPSNGRQKKQTGGPTSSRRARIAHNDNGSSLTTTVAPGRTARPSSSPPWMRRLSSKLTSVVLPDFHRLVSRVRLPAARKPSQSQETSLAAPAMSTLQIGEDVRFDMGRV